MKKKIYKKPFLTIGYATYNRKKLIYRRLKEIWKETLKKHIRKWKTLGGYAIVY